MAPKDSDGQGRRLRSRRWFDDPHDPAMTALYVERYLNYGLTREELQAGKPIIGGKDIDASDFQFVAQIYPKGAKAPAKAPARRRAARAGR